MRFRQTIIFLFLIHLSFITGAQTADSSRYKTIAASPSLSNRSEAWLKHWGKNRRAEWATPVTVPILYLDTAFGGLKIYEKGGGNESRTLHLQNPSGKEYTIRSISKSRSDVVPEDFKGTFVETIIKDGISSSYPYGAFVIPYMQEKAGLLYTKPLLVYLPKQERLDSFNERFGNDLYMVEQRPDGDWSDATNLGNINDFISTEKVIRKLAEEKKYEIDQYGFVKARLFDILVGDWDRHEGNWRWGKTEVSGKKWYVPVGRDRDQAFYTHNGAWLDKMLPMAGFSYMQHFDSIAGNPVSLNEESWDYDRFFSNEMALEHWIRAAKELQSALTDEVIAISVRGLPPEIFAVSGEELIGKLSARRDQLVDLATTYYQFLAKEVEIVGSKEKELVEITSSGSGDLTVSVYVISKKGKKDEPVYYQRTFKPAETNEIRIFGIGDDDIYKTDVHSPIIVRIIAGPGKDSLVHTGDRIHVYDNRKNNYQAAIALHATSDSSVHQHDYKFYHPDSKGFAPVIGYNYEDRVHAGLRYTATIHRWRKKPFAAKHSIGVNYSISQHAVSAAYNGLFPATLLKSDLFIEIGFDAVRWNNFYGTGNNSVYNFKKIGYHRTFSQEWLVATGLRRSINKSTVEVAAFYQRVKIKSDTGSYAAQYFAPDYAKQTNDNNYLGGWIQYRYVSVNHTIVPTKGFLFLAKAIMADNFTQEINFQHYTAKAQAFLPLSKKFSLSVKAGGTTVGGPGSLLNTAQVYQHAVIGGPESLRGYRMERFRGKTSFYNNNELRFITHIRSYILNAKIGLLGFFDDGRVWIPNEQSNKLHTSYGGGVLFAPFNQLSFTVTYGISDELKILQFRINTLL